MPYVTTYPPVVMVPNAMMGYSPMAVYPAPPAAIPVTGQPPISQAVVANPEPPPPVVQLTEEELKQVNLNYIYLFLFQR